jgi:hypothetical protein
MLLYPRLPRKVAEELAEARAGLPVTELIVLSDITHPAAIYAPTGGSRVEADRLKRLRTDIRNAATEAGYPADSTQASRGEFDAASAELLHDHMDISPAEASSQGVWAFMACVLLPDVVRWRFPGREETTVERFLGGPRGIRNTFGRVWWRAHVLRLRWVAEPYRLLRDLGEDEIVQIMERPNIAGSTALARETALAFLATVEKRPDVPRMMLLRDAMKRLRRLFPMMAFDAMDEVMLAGLLEEVFAEAVRYVGEGSSS